MRRAGVLLAAAAAVVAGAYAMLWLVDRLFGGNGPRIELASEHRRALDGSWPYA